jgi:hypothetical protein
VNRAPGVEILPGVRVVRGRVSVPVADPLATAMILSRALDPAALDEVVRLLLAAPAEAERGDVGGGG